jgi:poly-gamma-glutamate capsule biosynthesis protein CapA/YwtB (metallophosphatase superfamily)
MEDFRFKVMLSSVLVILSITVILYGYTSASEKGKSENSFVQHIYNNTRTIFLKVGNKDTSSVKLILAGDVMIGRTVEIKSKEFGDELFPFRNVAGRLNKADLVFANLENPVIGNCPIHESGFKFCSSPKMLEGLNFAGIDVVTLANNHIRNYGQKGLDETIKHLTVNNIDYVGLGDSVTREVNDTKFGFLGFDYLSFLPKETDLDLIRESAEKVDVLIVGVHWGVEYVEIPNEFQRKWARRIVEAGADVIAGHHPHWVQEIEYIGDVPVYYSLGNFVFDQMWSEKTKKGLVVELTYEDGKLINEETLPTYMSAWAQPEWVK